MSRRSQLFDRAADCARLMSAAPDPVTKGAFKQLRDMWIALANDSMTMSTTRLLIEIAAIDKMQSGLEARNSIQ